MAKSAFSVQVGDALRRARTAAGVPLSDGIENVTGYSKTQISNWENGRMEPRLSSISNLAAAYSTTPVDIVAAATAESSTPPPTEPGSLEDRVLALAEEIKQRRKPQSKP